MSFLYKFYYNQFHRIDDIFDLFLDHLILYCSLDDHNSMVYVRMQNCFPVDPIVSMELFVYISILLLHIVNVYAVAQMGCSL